MAAGESWLGQFELPHRLRNGSRADSVHRIHLIVDLWPSQLAARVPDPGCPRVPASADAADGAPLALLASTVDWTEVSFSRVACLSLLQRQRAPPTQLRRTEFGAALEAAHGVLFESAYLADAVAACAGAFNDYRWAVPSTTAERAAVEASWYGDSAATGGLG